MSDGITITDGVSIDRGVYIGISPEPAILLLNLDASTFAIDPTDPQQNDSGVNSNVGFFPNGWVNPPSSGGFGNIIAGWTVVGHTDWVVTAVDSVLFTITITGGTFINADSYEFTNEFTWFDSVSNKPFLLQNGVVYDYPAVGGSFEFVPASQQYAQCPISLSTLDKWTVEVWHYYAGTSDGGSPCIVTEVYPGTTSSINYALGSLNDNSPKLQTGFYLDGAFIENPIGYTLIPGNWYQIIGSYDGLEVKLYVNHTLVDTGPSTEAPLSSNGGIILMKRWEFLEFWGGNLGIVNIYQNAMSAAEIEASWIANQNRFGLGPPTFTTPIIMNAGAFQSSLQVNCSAITTAGLITVVGSNGDFGSATSSDGYTWTGPATAISANTFMYRVTWSSYHNLFLAIGTLGSPVTYPIYSTSSDGITWSSPTIIDTILISTVYAITVNSAGLFVAIMILPGGFAGYATSANISTWTTPTVLPDVPNGLYFFGADITVDSSGKFVVTGYDSNDQTPWFSISTDGSNWTSAQIVNSFFEPSSIVWSSYHNLFVSVGTIFGGIGFSTSSDGSTWKTPVYISGSTSLMEILSLAVSPNGGFVGVGQVQVGAIAQPLYISSPDGIYWSYPSLFNGSTAEGYMRAVEYSTITKSFVAVGVDAIGPNWLYAVTVPTFIISSADIINPYTFDGSGPTLDSPSQFTVSAGDNLSNGFAFTPSADLIARMSAAISAAGININQPYAWYVSWSTGGRGIARFEFYLGTPLVLLMPVDTTVSGWETNSVYDAGSAQAGTFAFPATFTAYVPPTQLGTSTEWS
jgi:hypothetical protein